jgi:hypothetical protein
MPYYSEHAMWKKLIPISFIIYSLTMFGCASGKLFMEHDDESLSLIKNYQDALEPEFQFLGKVKGAANADWQSISRDASFESESLLYGKVGNKNIVEKGVIIRTYKIRGESANQLAKFFPKNKHILDSGDISIAGKDYSYDLFAMQDILELNEKKIIADKSLLIKDCYLVKEYRGDVKSIINKSKSRMLYFDAVDTGQTDVQCKQLADPNTLSEKDKSRLRDFSHHSDEYIFKLLNGKSIVDMSASKPVQGKAADEKMVVETTEIEKKLSALKILLDKGLITQSDYDKKKAELLDNF